MSKSKKKQKRRKSFSVRARDYFRKLIGATLQSAVSYLFQTLVLVAAVTALSLFKWAALGTIAVLFLLLRDLIAASENDREKSSLITIRLFQNIVVYGLSLVLNDSIGMIGSEVIIVILGSYLVLNAANWVTDKVDRLDQWLQNPRF